MIQYYDMFGMPISMERWSQLLGEPRHVRQTWITLYGTRFHVSTVWLGLNYSFIPGSPPLIFETMVFADDSDSPADQACTRYSTRRQAIIGHQRAVRWLRGLTRDLAREKRTKRQPVIHNGGKP